MNQDILDYLEQNYCSLERLVQLTGVSGSTIKTWIANGTLPAHSYRIDEDGSIHSVFGIRKNVAKSGPERFYFNAALVDQIQTLQETEKTEKEFSESLKDVFFEQYLATLLLTEMPRFGMASFFDAQLSPVEAMGELLESEWNHYLAGTYGLCTRTASPMEIATKEAMIRKINFITSNGDKAILSDTEKNELNHAIQRLDQVSSAFAPHEVEHSSRQKYIVEMAHKYQCVIQ